ncbi:hypothetical protein HRbin28_01770 [bacterium HR28]|nr:hypothetical protein HRbin28_01770 [bacterium HR28]
MERLGELPEPEGGTLGAGGPVGQPLSSLPRRDVDVETTGWIALALEAIFGWFGILGVGHAYVGRLALGIGLFFGWLLILGLLGVLTSVTFGIALCLTVPVWVAVPVVSGLLARRYALAYQLTGSWGRALAYGGIGCLGLILLTCVGVVVLTLFFGSIGALLSAAGQQ